MTVKEWIASFKRSSRRIGLKRKSEAVNILYIHRIVFVEFEMRKISPNFLNRFVTMDEIKKQLREWCQSGSPKI